MVLTVICRNPSFKWHWFPLQRMLSSHPNVACHTRIVMGNYNQLMYRGVTLILIVVQVLFCTQWSSIIFQKRFLSVLQWTKNFCCRCSGFIWHATEIDQWVNVFEKNNGQRFLYFIPVVVETSVYDCDSILPQHKRHLVHYIFAPNWVIFKSISWIW